MNRLEGDRGTHDSGPGGDHDLEYKKGFPKVFLNWHEQLKLKSHINALEVEKRRCQEHSKRPEIQRAIDRAQAELEKRKRAGK